ncbi:MAG: hypothetical protein ACPG4U_13020 [Pseudomonadales bacterium]
MRGKFSAQRTNATSILDLRDDEDKQKSIYLKRLPFSALPKERNSLTADTALVLPFYAL